MFDAAPNATMNSLTGWVKESLQETSSFWSSLKQEIEVHRATRFSGYFTATRSISMVFLLTDWSLGQSHAEANRTFRTLVTLLVRVILLSDIHATAGYAHGRPLGACSRLL
jgi:hypothetical protein